MGIATVGHMVARIETPLKRILDDEGRSQAWLARRLGASRQSVGFWVHGIYCPVRETQVAIADLLGRSVGELWPGQGAESDQTDSGLNSDRLSEAA